MNNFIFLMRPLKTFNYFFFYSSNTAQYEEDNNSVRMYLRGRPVTLYVPEKRADAVNYDIAKVQPAPSRKLKLDWVRIKIKLKYLRNFLSIFLFLGLRISRKRLPQ